MNLKKTLIAGVAAASLLGTSAVAFAQSSSSANTPATYNPTACSAAFTAQSAALQSAKDAMHAAEKAASQTQNTAIAAALALSDETARNTALKAAHEAYRTAMQAAMETFRTSTQSTMETMRTACGGLGKHGGIFPMSMGMKMKGPGHMGHGKMDMMKGFRMKMKGGATSFTNDRGGASSSTANNQ